jgi:hypothetical protein
MANNITVRDGNGLPEVLKTVETGGVHTPVHRIDGYDPFDDMVKMKSVQKKWRDSFTQPLSTLWDVVTADGTTATVSGGLLTIASGTTAGGYAELLSKETFTIPCRVMAGINTGSARQANTHHYVELVSVDPVTGQPNDLHRVAWDFGGAATTTLTQAVYEVQNGGIVPLSSVSGSTNIQTTNGLSVLELEPFSDEAYFHSRQIDNAAVGRSNSYVRQQQIPDPNALYKIRVRSMNFTSWRPISGAVAGTGGVIRITCTAHAALNGEKVWVESLNGVLNGTSMVRGVYTITLIDANTFELNGTVFAGTYVTGTGRAARGQAPAASISYLMQFINCQDYAELTAEITAGRGSTAAGQASSVLLAGATAASTPIGQVNIAASQTVGLVAGSAAIGDAGIQYRANATGAATLTNVNCPATPAAQQLKSGAGRLLSLTLTNTNAAARYLKIFNALSASVTPGTTSALAEIAIPPGRSVVWTLEGGAAFSTGITVMVTAGQGLTNNGVVTLGDVTGIALFA